MRFNKINVTFLLLVPLGLFVACATVVPMELANARTAYQRASTGSAAQLAPAEVHKARAALDQAEQAFASDPESRQTKDLAYVAERKAQLAEALASVAADEQRKAQAQQDLQAAQAQQMKQTKGELSNSRRDLAASERGRAGEAQARVAAESRADEADERARQSAKALADLASVKQEQRGMVITLSGSVLFATNKSTLLPAAQERLNRVAEALLTTRERGLIVEGHTDSRGSDKYNLDLSQRRADSVRAYLVSRGYLAGRIQAHGIGKARPVSENGTAEGRANNRRVEIIVEREMHSAR
jgi:outer membrane protein OmpA-like peptidoglycan-associated protein